MVKLRHAYAAPVLLLWPFLPAAEARAQVPPPVSYVYMEVKDTSWKPLSDGPVVVVGDDGNEYYGEKTDKNGVLRNACRVSYRFN